MRHNARSNTLTALVLVAALGTLTACSPVEAKSASVAVDPGGDDFGTVLNESEAVKGGDLVMGLSSEPDTLDPTQAGTSYSRFVLASMCEKLYDTDEKASIVPQLATDLPEISDDGLTYTIPLRSDAVFADGTPMDAAAVANSLQRAIDLPTSKRRSELGPINSIEVVDKSHVALHYTTPFSVLPAVLADRAGMIMSPTALKTTGDDGFGTSPVCVGPFKFVSWVPQTAISLEKDPNYYAADKVYLDTIEFRLIIDASVRGANLQSGDIDVADTLSTQNIDAIAADPNLKVLKSSALGWRGLVVNVANTSGPGKPTGDIEGDLANNSKVREALSYAVDREALVETAFGGWYTSACSPIREGSDFATDVTTACNEYDPDKSKALLKEAGVAVPFELTILGSTNTDTQRYLQALQSQLPAAGFSVKLDPREESSLVSQINVGDFSVLFQEWSGRVDPDGNMRAFLSTGGSQNYSGFSTPELDDALNKASVTSDLEGRKALYEEATSIVQEENPLIVLFRSRNLTGVATGLNGVQVFPDGLPRLAFAAFSE
ncbi:ABC transporter substrate-binding protein [Cryobacterium sp. Y82]|uniref:ABC transporter substrate-binding protein n=1 Tax=Cryobacterium sp. Y82 TaxID=2045017 RepID=UPI000CE4FC8E|nr:ABC transporter substrate-binding protein [Cryobacterium sp. Y82]